MHLTNTSTPGDGEIEGYVWLFPDGTRSDSEHATFFFEEPGSFPISLVATSSLGCADTVTNKVYVKETPVAGIELASTFVEAFVPTQFF